MPPRFSFSRRLTIIGAALLGAAAVGLAWWLFGGAGGGTAVALEPDPGIAPPDYVYLDEARVVSYLGQIQGGLATSDKVTEQVSRSGGANAGAAGVGLSASLAQSASLERVVTPTAAARFYGLLALLRSRGYLRTIDAGEPPQALVRDFAKIPEGTFVRLRDCQLRLPSYIQIDQLIRQSRGRLDALNAYIQGISAPGVSLDAVVAAERAAGRVNGGLGSSAQIVTGPVAQRLQAAARQLVRALGTNPRVPLATCSGGLALKPRGVDLLIPVRLGLLSPERSLTAGPVTVVGKVVRDVRNDASIYADDGLLAGLAAPLLNFDAALQPTGYGATSLEDELDADAVVLPPGAVILPLAIYK